MSSKSRIAILHYTSPPVMGGVESVIYAHSRELVLNGHDVTIIAGRGDSRYVSSGLPWGANLELIAEMDSLDPQVLQITDKLDHGNVPLELHPLTDSLEGILGPMLKAFDNVFIHNLWTKHFNFPLTIALYRLLESGQISNLINWCHDFTWGSPNSGNKMHPGFPWDLLRTLKSDVKYVVGSHHRQYMLATLLADFNDEPEAKLIEKIQVIPNGVSPSNLIGLTNAGEMLVNRLSLLSSDLILLMPVRISQAKNIEFALEVVSELKTLVDYPNLVITGPPDPHNPEDKTRYENLKEKVDDLQLGNIVHFVYDAGFDKSSPNLIDHNTVGQLMRVADVVFMPSHREGFGIPVFEAGLLRIPVWCSSNVPAARELESDGVNIFDLSEKPITIAKAIHESLLEDSQHVLRREIRQNYTWDAIYRNYLSQLV